MPTLTPRCKAAGETRWPGVMQGRTVQPRLGEALNEPFRKRGQLPIARE